MQRNFKASISLALILALYSASSPVNASNRGPDFDNDNIDDIAIGVPWEDYGTLSGAGLVNILYGSSSGLDDPSNRITSLYRDGAGVDGIGDDFDFFGQSLAWGDFNGDCYDDLAVGLPGAGDLHIFYGSSTGLSTTNDTIPVAAQNDFLGVSAASGDFNGDGYDDVALGSLVGEVYVVYGSSGGITDTAGPGLQIWDLDALSVSPNEGSNFGWSLATGDFNCDGKDDLAVGAPGEDVGIVGAAGQVHIIYGTTSGLAATNTTAWNQATANVEGAAETSDEFGRSLATGNFNNDTSGGHACHDLAIGIPWEDSGATNSGAVAVLYGTSASGIQATSPADNLWYPDLAGIEGTPDAFEHFGTSLVVGNMDTDSFEDLAIGSPGDGVGGSVAIIRGASGGMTDVGDVVWTQDTTNVGDSAESDDLFGECLGYGREWYTSLNRGLAVCAPGEDHNSTTDVGMVNVMYLQDTSTPQISFVGNTWLQNSIDTQVSEADDAFGSSIAAPRDRPFTNGSCG